MKRALLLKYTYSCLSDGNVHSWERNWSKRTVHIRSIYAKRSYAQISFQFGTPMLNKDLKRSCPRDACLKHSIMHFETVLHSSILPYLPTMTVHSCSLPWNRPSCQRADESSETLYHHLKTNGFVLVASNLFYLQWYFLHPKCLTSDFLH
jgi:hypothetical protein